ncbi:hypothetical protein T06_600 [Trichinella sp. T6]|nr:hypothetical protein T06_600 [Trichinella sp. T6]
MKAIAVLLRIRRCRIKSLFSTRFRSIHKYATDTSQPICPVNKETQISCLFQVIIFDRGRRRNRVGLLS